MTLRSITIVLGLLLSLPCVAVAQPAAPAPGGQGSWVDTALGHLRVWTWRGAQSDGHKLLVVVLHGDSPTAPPTYQYRFATQVAAQFGTVVASAILRPGYSDGQEHSDGEHGRTDGDNYTPEVVDAMAEAITALRAQVHASQVVLVGHSGGAAISADLLGRHPGLVQAAVLVSCPCDVPGWRQYMGSVRKTATWARPVNSLSPMTLVSAIPRSTQVRMIVGTEDTVAPPRFTETYAASLRTNGIPVEVTQAPGLPHNILLRPVVFDVLRQILAQMDGG